MSINHTLKTQPVSPAHIQQEVKLNQRNLANSAKSSTATAEKGTDVKLSALTQQIKTDTSRDVDMERVQQIKAAIRNGDLKMDYEKIAQALLQNILDDR
ncbi:flagellar biosynthesis anti-sigma factor FlgM [Mixta sp. Marseille-Q2659]|uniref:flagellar biosynthesis anti-sigma factor FlgM n=1 Tax=Mixta sp. Marseille-Q2659 TaxID=2736607 RepID=UPI0023B918EB|nr:flagellar biosynthesis anti-sigma factor FlgM [Mixta sp. Marseille-Q2659]